MKVAYIQFSPTLASVNDTIKKIDGLISMCESADLVVLPELCNSGYNFTNKKMAWESAEEIERSIFIDYLEDKCLRNNFFIVSGFNERCNEDIFNSAILVGSNGLIGKYRKLHLFMKEKDFFTPGDLGLKVFDIGICKVGMLVCFDWIFPEVWRILALKGADIICHPCNLVLSGFAQKAVPVHALVNRVYVITCNRVGKEGELSFTGLSTMADPKGEIVCQSHQKDEDVKLVNINLDAARSKKITERNDIFTDRRPSEYKFLTEPAKNNY